MPKAATSRSNTENSEEQKPTIASGADASCDIDDGHTDPKVCMSQCVTVQCYRLVEVVKSTCNLSHFQYLSCVHHTHVVRMLVWKLCIESTLRFYLLPATTYCTMGTSTRHYVLQLYF